MEPNNNLMAHILDSRPPLETIPTPAGPLYLIHKDYKLDTTSIHAPQSFSLDLPIFHPILNHQFTASIKSILYWSKTKDGLHAEIKQIHPNSIFLNAIQALKSDVKAFTEAEISKSTVLLIA
jgi:hypothetical protein